MATKKSYFTQALAIIVFSVIAFVFIKPFLPTKLFPDTLLGSKNVVVDSLMMEALAADASVDPNAKGAYELPKEWGKEFSDLEFLLPFYEKLYQLETAGAAAVRIAYFGDSMTDGDMVVQDFRANFQNQFGGEGVGFVNITSESAASRNTVKHEFSNNWTAKSFVNTKRPPAPFGLSGNVFIARDTLKPTWAKYQASNQAHLNQLVAPQLFYGKSANKSAVVGIVKGRDTLYKKLNGRNLVNTLDLGGTTKKLSLNFIKSDSIPLYGVNFDDGKGVHVDNFSNRGNSGLPIVNIKSEILRAFDSQLNYDLIVLHYGTNVLNYGSLNFSWYEKKMKGVLEHLKQSFPNAAILVISTADKSTKYNDEMKTDSAVVPLTLSQRKYAKETQASFVNLFTLMGGDGSMVHWVEEEPSKANKDYTHFNHRGSKVISGLIYQQLMDGYSKYKMKRSGQPFVPKTLPVVKSTEVTAPKVQDTSKFTSKPGTTNSLPATTTAPVVVKKVSEPVGVPAPVSNKKPESEVLPKVNTNVNTESTVKKDSLLIKK